MHQRNCEIRRKYATVFFQFLKVHMAWNFLQRQTNHCMHAQMLPSATCLKHESSNILHKWKEVLHEWSNMLHDRRSTLHEWSNTCVAWLKQYAVLLAFVGGLDWSAQIGWVRQVAPVNSARTTHAVHIEVVWGGNHWQSTCCKWRWWIRWWPD